MIIYLRKDNWNNFYIINHVPGQAAVLQSFVSDAEPSQLLPPPDGAGLLHVLVLDCCPVPQVLVQVEYSDHVAHMPLTKCN